MDIVIDVPDASDAFADFATVKVVINLQIDKTPSLLNADISL
jgi:hypothetical protein